MIFAREQLAIRIVKDELSGKIHMTTSEITVTLGTLGNTVRTVSQASSQKPQPTENKALLVDWNCKHSDHGILLSAQIAGAALNYESRVSAWVRLRLNDRQLRELTLDLVKASMMRGIEFGASRRWWQVWSRSPPRGALRA